MALKFLEGGGDAGAAIRAVDWASTPLGPPELWPAALKTSLAAMLGTHFPQAICWGADLITFHNDAFRPILGQKPAAIGRPFGAIWAEAWGEIGPIAARALAGEATYIEDFPLVIERSGQPETAYFTFCYSPIRDEWGKVVGLLDTVVETSATVRAQARTRLLAGELSHRLKNMLSIVQAIAHQSFPGDAAAQAVFSQRLSTLGAANDLLTAADWTGADIAEVVRAALLPHLDDPARATIDGPAVQLGAREALSLALAVHELATNAIKYGALSVPAGRVAIRWEAGAPGSAEPFRFRWSEAGGPAVTPPARTGFGSRLTGRMLPRDFAGTVDADYRADGLRFTLETRMDRLNRAEG